MVTKFRTRRQRGQPNVATTISLLAYFSNMLQQKLFSVRVYSKHEFSEFGFPYNMRLSARRHGNERASQHNATNFSSIEHRRNFARVSNSYARLTEIIQTPHCILASASTTRSKNANHVCVCVCVCVRVCACAPWCSGIVPTQFVNSQTVVGLYRKGSLGLDKTVSRLDDSG